MVILLSCTAHEGTDPIGVFSSHKRVDEYLFEKYNLPQGTWKKSDENQIKHYSKKCGDLKSVIDDGTLYCAELWVVECELDKEIEWL